MKFLITGVSGFVGEEIALFLKNKIDFKLLGIDKIEDVISKSINFEKCDLFHEKAKLEKIFNNFNPDVVIHMAAQSLVRKSYEFPVETFNTNVIGTANLLDCLRSQQNEKPVVIVVVTSDKCYQNNDLGLAFCEADVLGGRDPYSSSKACAELVVQSFRDSFFSDKEHRLRVATGRAGNVIGGGDGSRDRLIPDAMRAFARGQAVNLRNPNSIRPWQHVLDPIVGYLTLCEQLYLQGDRCVGGWNFGPNDNDVMTVEWIIKKMYFIHFYDQKLRTHMIAMDTDTVISVRDGDSGVTKINRNEMTRSMASIKAQEYNELQILVGSYKMTKATPIQVAGDDTQSYSYDSTKRNSRNDKFL